MKSKLFRRCLSFICAVSLVSGILSPAGSLVYKSAGFTVYAEGEAEGETIKTEAMGIFLTLLLGSGFRMVGSFADQAQALGNQFDQWLAETQATITAGTIVAGTMFQNGWMKLSSDVANAYNSFASWLTETLSIPSTGTVDVPTGNTSAVGSYLENPANNLISGTASNGSTWYFNNNVAGRYVALNTTDHWCALYFVALEAGAVGSNTSSNVSINKNLSWTTVNNTRYYYVKVGQAGTANWYNFMFPVYEGTQSHTSNYDANAIYYTYGDLAMAPDDQILTGESLDLKDGIGLDQDQALLYDISALAEYAGVLDQTLTDAQDLVGVLTDSIARSKADADEDEDAEVIPWDLVDSDTDSKVAPDDITDVPPNTTGQYKVLGLEKIFPFSIPFDIYYFIKMFNAPAEPLQFDMPLVVHGLVNETYHVDLTMFNPVAVVFRLMMLVGFVWFLITKTRDFLRS